MIRAEIQLPDELYQRVRQFGDERELSLTEVARRGLELLLERYPVPGTPVRPWALPVFDGGGIKIPLDRLREVSGWEEEARSLRGH